MALRIAALTVFSFLLLPQAWAQTVRFDTNVGNIDVVLNPTANGNLDVYVDNLLRYVEAGLYENVVLNRADNGIDPDDPADDFVLQFGGFFSPSPIYTSFLDFQSVPSFDPVIVDADNDGNVDFGTNDLTNSRGTITMALAGSPNTGTSSFFANLGNNGFLDASGFVPFAEVADMSTIDYIMRLPQQSEPIAGLASSNIPVTGPDDNLLIYVQKAFILDPNPAVPTPAAPAPTALATLLEGGPDGGIDSVVPPAGSPTVVSVPEPPALVLVVGAVVLWTVLKPAKLRY